MRIKDGIININKPAGMTSHDCIYAVRRLTGIKRVGHMGTLDPNATGVLPVCIGSCTRITEYTDVDLKTYDCTMELGVTTDTQDIWGTILSDKRQELFAAQSIAGAMKINEAAVREAFAGLNGVIDQYPPKYSAVRYGGRHLYEYAREGREVEIKPRKVYIRQIEIKETALEELPYTVRFTVTCGKGTYIRAICQEVGDRLGCGAAMTSLVRTASGRFTLEDAVELSYLQELAACREEPETEAAVSALILPPDYPLTAFGKAVIKEAGRARWFVNGGHIKLSETKIVREPRYKREEAPFTIRAEYKDAYCVYGHFNESDACAGEEAPFLGVAFYHYGYKKLVVDKVFRRIDENI